MIHARQGQEGFSLIIAVTIIVLLTMLGMMVLESVHVDTQIAGGDRSAQNALYIAEAGALWGKTELEAVLYGAGITPVFTNLDVLPTIPDGHRLCPDSSTTPCNNWRRLHVPNSVAYGDGEYVVAARCDSATCAARSSNIVFLRSLGSMTNGGARMIEVVIGE